MIRRHPTLSATLILALAACAGPPVDEETASPAPAAEVAWFEGGPDEAFALARAEGKPLFLYWGAEWCPPCHYLKEKIFSRPEFVARSRDFVAVYLDGDDAGAQVLGEQLDVQGYPTVMVYSAAGEELLRMPSDVPVARYAAILERALTLDRPIREILGAVLAAGPATAPAADLDVLAYYSWGQDSQIELPEEELLPTFRRLWEETPAELAGVRARFLALYVGEAARRSRGAGEGEPPVLTAGERSRLTAAVTALLADVELARENVTDVLSGAAAAIAVLQPAAGPERSALAEAWREAALRFEADEELSTDDRLTATLTAIELARLAAGDAEAPLPEALVAHVRQRVAWAIAATADGGELQTVLNTAAYALEQAGLPEEAERLLADKQDETYAPYYFMSFRAGLESDAGRSAEAVALYRQAWQAAAGRYTRFRWGSTYLRRLMELAPDDVAAVRADSVAIFDELLTHDDAFALGNYLRLGQLETAYGAWNEDGSHDGVVDLVRDLVHAACDRYPAAGEDSQRARCAAFLEG
ncbi:MAG: thioredoxin family protein [Acidobacteriota bacterium]|nr:thioredoxin family protein [Acidobacteriota bacterium]MDH3524499.1 thioredoxin family protein [Acidobacteriota bacterium]